jgi:hypothetical protein
MAKTYRPELKAAILQTQPAGSRRRVFLLWRVQIALKPASKAPGLHGVFMRDKGLKFVIADSAFNGPCWGFEARPRKYRRHERNMIARGVGVLVRHENASLLSIAG